MVLDEVVIRKFNFNDREKVRQIFCETAFLGESYKNFFEGEDTFADALSKYYTDYEPESCFIAERNGQIVGCLIGTKNVLRMVSVFKWKILLPGFFKAVRKGVFFQKKNLVFFFRCAISLVKGEFWTPNFCRKYPATLHINLVKSSRCLGVGPKLIHSYLGYLKKEKIAGVHFATMSQQASRFFEREGFELLFKGQRTYWKHIVKTGVPLYIYGMILL